MNNNINMVTFILAVGGDDFDDDLLFTLCLMFVVLAYAREFLNRMELSL